MKENGKWISTKYVDEHNREHDGFIYDGPVPEHLDLAEQQVWRDLCRKPNIIVDILNSGFKRSTCYDLIKNEINDSCRMWNISGPDNIRYGLLIAYYEVLILDHMSAQIINDSTS